MSGQSDEYRERLDVVAFRIWRRVLPLLNWISRERLGRTFAVIGFLLALAAAFAVGGLELPALLVAFIAVLSAFGYALDRRVRRIARRRAAGPDSKIHPCDFLCAPLTLDPSYRLARPADGSMAQLYPYVDLSHHDVFIQMENESSGHGISVVDLDEHGILQRPHSKNPIVLIDT